MILSLVIILGNYNYKNKNFKNLLTTSIFWWCSGTYFIHREADFHVVKKLLSLFVEAYNKSITPEIKWNACQLWCKISEFQAHQQPVPVETSKQKLWCGVGLCIWCSSQCFLSSSSHPSFPAAIFHQPWVTSVYQKSVWCYNTIGSLVNFKYKIALEYDMLFDFLR